jgi:hypothetical protein
MPRPASILIVIIPSLATGSGARNQATSEWHLDRERRFGNSSQQDEILMPATILVDHHMNVHILDTKTGKFFVFDTGGRLLRTFGRRGRGPGEFDYVGLAGCLKDTVWVATDSRVTFFAGTAAKPSVPQLPSSVLTGAGFRPKALLSDGSVLREHWRPGHNGSGTIFTYDRIDRQGHSRNVVLENMSDGPVRMMVDGNPFSAAPWLFAPQIVSTDTEGQFIYNVDARAPRNDEDGPIPISRFSPDGKLLWSIRAPSEAKRASSATRDSLINFYHGEARRAVAAAMPHYYPRVERVAVGRDGSVFIADGRRENFRRWTIVRSNGKVDGFIRLPATTWIVDANRTHIWVLEYDQRDQPVAARYRMVR